MTYTVTLENVSAQSIIAVRARARIPEIAAAWKPALDQVWTFLRAHPELRPGHNVFLYHHPERRSDPMDIDFGVALHPPVAVEPPVFSTETPAGVAATTLHVGPYSGLHAAHDAIHSWCSANSRQIGSESWEVYGDWTEDASKLETRIFYLLRL